MYLRAVERFLVPTAHARGSAHPDQHDGGDDDGDHGRPLAPGESGAMGLVDPEEVLDESSTSLPPEVLRAFDKKVVALNTTNAALVMAALRTHGDEVTTEPIPTRRGGAPARKKVLLHPREATELAAILASAPEGTLTVSLLLRRCLERYLT